MIKWIALFGIAEIKQRVVDSLNFLITQHRIELHGFVIMEHHLHLIASGDSLSKDIGIFKSYSARQIIDYLIANHYDRILKQLRFFKKQHKKLQEYQIWEEGSHPQLLTNVEMLNRKLDYMHYNPVRSGYVDDPAHWRYSSYRYYEGMPSLLPITVLS